MNITHEHMMHVTATRPMKTIIQNGTPLFERYYISGAPDGSEVWAHRFLRNDPEPHLHSHSWKANIQVLVGWITEERKLPQDTMYLTWDTERSPEYYVDFDTVHRVEAVAPNTWTMLAIHPERRENWSFFEPNGDEIIVAASPRDWWSGCKTRDNGEPSNVE